jgi:hypothetical protein
MSVSESAYLELGRRLMTHSSLPEGLRSLKATVDKAVTAYDSSGLEQALLSLGKAAHSQKDLDLIPEDLRPLFSIEQSPESESMIASRGESGPRNPSALRSTDRKGATRPMFNLIDCCLALSILAMCVYGYVKFMRTPSVSPSTPDVTVNHAPPPQIPTSPTRPAFRPMPMIRQGALPSLPATQPERRSGWLVATKPRRPGTSADQAALSRARRDFTTAELSVRGDQSEVGQAMAVLNRFSAVLASQLRGTELAAVAESYRQGEAIYYFREREHNISENLGEIGLEWVLSLMEQARIPLQVIHKVLVDWPEPACVVELGEVPLAMRLLKAEHLSSQDDDTVQPDGDDSVKLPGDRPYTEARRLEASNARQALVFPRYAVRRDHELVFENLSQIDEDAAILLATHRHSLSFPALEELTEEVAAALAQHVGGWSSTGAAYDDVLTFGGLKNLSPAVAGALATRSSGTLELGSSTAPLPEITEATARCLSQYRGRLLSLHVRQMSRESQEYLAAFTGILLVNSGDGERSREAEASNHGLANLCSAALMETLCRNDLDPLVIECRSITAEAISSLISHAYGRDVVFTCLEEIPDDAAAYYLDLAGEVTFPRLRRVSPKALQILGSKRSMNWE